MWQARTKDELIIEVWEKLDCENVGASEIQSIETVVKDTFGPQALDSPMRIARLLADEGAELRHSEIMKLWVERFESLGQNADLRNIFKFSTFSESAATIRKLENLRRKYTSDGSRDDLRRVREAVIEEKKRLQSQARSEYSLEIAEWLTIWLQTPEMFENWASLRQNSKDFKVKFSNVPEQNT